MGGAGFVFTGENDADIMHNSVSINLNVLEEQRKWNEITELNKTKIFYSGSACMYPEHNQLDPDNPDCLVKNQHTPQTQTLNTDGKNFFLNDFTLPIIVIIIFLFGLLDIIISLDLKGPGTVEGRSFRAAICRKVSYLPESGGAIEVWGDGYKLVPSCSLMNALKQLED